MSFSTDIKQEISKRVTETHCRKAELSALLKLTSSLTISNGNLGFVVRTENPTTAKRIVFLLKEIYDAETELQIYKKTNLKKNNVYTIEVHEEGRTILDDLDIYNEKGVQAHPRYDLIMRNCCAASYLAGAFLAYGACNDPQNPNYHMEISLPEIENANFLVKLLSRFQIEAKIVKRRARYIVYVKKADHVSDFLALIGAHDAMMRFEDERIGRDVNNSIRRIDNCEIANEVKTLKAAQQQIANMQKIIDSGRYEHINEKLRNVIDIRLKYQDSSLLELCEAYQKNYGEAISKSGMKHRLNRIDGIADRLEEQS